MNTSQVSSSRFGPPRLTLLRGGLSMHAAPAIRVLTRAGEAPEGRRFFFVIDLLAGLGCLASIGGVGTLLLLPLLTFLQR